MTQKGEERAVRTCESMRMKSARSAGVFLSPCGMQYASYHSRFGGFSRDLMCLMIAASCTPSGSATSLVIHR